MTEVVSKRCASILRGISDDRPDTSTQGQIGDSRANETPQKRAIDVLVAVLNKHTLACRAGAPAYLLAVERQAVSREKLRVRVLILARDGRYKAMWVARSKLGLFQRQQVTPGFLWYPFLEKQADTSGVARRMFERGEI